MIDHHFLVPSADEIGKEINEFEIYINVTIPDLED